MFKSSPLRTFIITKMSITKTELEAQSKRLVDSCPGWSLLKFKGENIDFMLTMSEIRAVGPKIYGIEYNVSYNESYEVPVMYFNPHRQDGTIADLDEIFTQELPSMSISQVEHPVLFRPCFLVHPCRTKEFMKDHKTSNYLLTWLTVIGNLIGLKIEITQDQVRIMGRPIE